MGTSNTYNNIHLVSKNTPHYHLGINTKRHEKDQQRK